MIKMFLQTFLTLPCLGKEKREGWRDLASLRHFKFAASNKETLVAELESSPVKRHVVISSPSSLYHHHSTPQVTTARRQTTKCKQMVTSLPPNCLISPTSFLSPPPTSPSIASLPIAEFLPPALPPPVYLSVWLFVFALSLQKQTAFSPVIDTAAERRRAETRCLPARPGMRFTRLTAPPPTLPFVCVLTRPELCATLSLP